LYLNVNPHVARTWSHDPYSPTDRPARVDSWRPSGPGFPRRPRNSREPRPQAWRRWLHRRSAGICPWRSGWQHQLSKPRRRPSKAE